MKSTTAERLQQIMKERNLRQADILEMIKPYCEKYNVNIPRNALSQYVTGKVLPKQDKLTVLGLALNVSEIWLMGFDVPCDRVKNEPVQTDEPQRDEFVRLFSSLSSENRQRMIDLMKALLAAQ